MTDAMAGNASAIVMSQLNFPSRTSVDSIVAVMALVMEPKWNRSWDVTASVPPALRTPPTATSTTLSARMTQISSEGNLYVSRRAVSYTHLRAHETRHDLVCRLLLEK